MADDKNKRGKPDRVKVAGQEPYEVKFVAKKLGVTDAAVKAAIKKVGNSRPKVEAELKRKK
jgi:hypothetical protein